MKKGRKFELWYPWLGAIAVALAYAAYGLVRGEPELADWRREFLSMVIDVSAISSGFLGTAVTIVLSLDGRESIRHLKASGTYKDLVAYLLQALGGTLVLTVISLGFVAGMLAKIPLYEHPNLHCVVVAAWVGIAAGAVLLATRVILIFWDVLTFDSEVTHD